MGKRKDKPRWKDLSFDERALKIAKRKGCSEFTLNFLKERIAKNNASKIVHIVANVLNKMHLN